jgi:hypothetical protein
MRAKDLLVVVVSTVVGLLLWEAGLRLFTGYGAHDAAQPVSVPAEPPNVADAARYIRRLAGAGSPDQRWFAEDPPPLPNRTPPSPAVTARYRDFERRGLFGPQAGYVWNSYLVKRDQCNPAGLFRNFPDTLLAFTPGSVSIHPGYRFPANQTLESGLVTNQFGLRGHPISLVKPAKTIRIAFLGASTTVNSHNYAFSYPEHVEHWLNRFAQANGYDVRFEALNSGREGINSNDIAAIMREELLALDPDLAVYYEGSNQFTSANLLVRPIIPPRAAIDAHDPVVQHKLPEFLRTHFAIGDLLDRALNRFHAVGEPRKPYYRLQWPNEVDRDDPNPDSPDLPLQLSAIVKDLDAIRADLNSIGGRLAVCSFEWFTPSGAPLSPTRHEFIYKQLNTVLWPLRYVDIRRLSDFQNRVFRNYAASRKIPFLDVAGELPQDPDLFMDAIHMTEVGERVKAWIVFQQLAPVIRRLIESGQLPHHNDAAHLPRPPSMAVTEMSTHCPVPAGPGERIGGAVSLEAIERALDGVLIEPGRPTKITMVPQQWSSGATFALHIPSAPHGDLFVLIRARVLNGQVGVGVLDREMKGYQVEKFVDAGPEMTDIYLPVPLPETASSVLVRNTAKGAVASQIVIEDLALVAAPARRLQ